MAVHSESHREPQTVLIVEDDANLRYLFANALQAVGYRVEQASDGVSALQMIENDRPDLVILDIGLPTLDGLSVRDEIIAQASSPPLGILFVTGYAEAFGDRLRDDCVLKKPVTRDQLVAKVRDCLLPRAD